MLILSYTINSKLQAPNSKENMMNWNLGFVFWCFECYLKMHI